MVFRLCFKAFNTSFKAFNKSIEIHSIFVFHYQITKLSNYQIMKKVFFLLLALSCTQLFAQNEKFTAAMKSTLLELKSATTPDAMIAVEAKFERIGDAEKTEWLPYYYAGTLKARLSMQHAGGDPDKLADDVSALAAKADSLSPKNSEVFCLKAMAASSKLMVDPQTRWMQYGSEYNKMLETAKKLDSTNPRPFVLQAISIKNTPEAFGGGCTRAKPLAAKAIKLLADFKPATELSPIWGKETVEGILEDCK